ncbi:MAG: OmpH family outer membrane protein [Planctomycetes bacterium]|nr:OmpH family outer membrane protein [Planctomycetota bacterium]
MKKLLAMALITLVIVAAGKLTWLSGQAAETPPVPPVPPVPAPAPAGIKIGVVNIFDVFSKFKKRDAYQKELSKEEAEEYRSWKKDYDDVIMENQKLMEENNDPNSDLWATLSSRIETLRMQKEQRIKLWRKRMNKKINTQMAQLYNEVRETIDAYGKEKGFALILKTEPDRIVNSNNQDEDAQMGINFRTVLFSQGAVDITADIIKKLNGE